MTALPSRLRVLHVIPALAPRYGGPSVAAVGMCRALLEDGVDVLLAATDADGASRLSVKLGHETMYEGVPAIFFRRRLSESFKWGPELASWLGTHVAEFDVVHVHAVFSHSSIAASRACVASGVPYLVRPLGTLDPWSVGRKRLRKRVLFAVGARKMLRRAAAMHYTSDAERQLAESVVPDLPRPVVVPLGISEGAFEQGASATGQSPYVLSLSRLDPKKGIDVLVQAFEAVARKDEFHAWRLIIAGDGDPLFVSTLRAQVDASAAKDRIEFRGWVDGAAKRQLLSNAWLLAAPSQQVNFGISIVEALAAGTPALVTPGVNLAADISAAGAGWVVEQGVAAVAEGLRRAMADSEGLRAARPRARTFAAQFKWPVVAAALSRVYEDIAGSTAHSARRFVSGPRAATSLL